MRPAALPAFPALLLLAGLAGCLGSGPDTTSAPAFERATFQTIASTDGHPIPVTIYRPEVATADNPVPAVLHSHGWGGSREARLDAFRAFTDGGLAVVSIDMRGHGEARATSQARVASPAYEIADVQAVLDHLAGLDWVRKEAEGDPLVGAMGESYGGASPLLTAALDPRLDAVVARDTWNDLVHALAPNGVPKTAWVASLWLSASIQGRIHPDVRAGFEQATRQATMPEALAAALSESSPGHYAGRIRVPTLLLQGIGDSLFDVGEALRTHGQVRAADAPVALVTHLAGHSLDTPVRGDDTQGPAARHPCGLPDDLALRWMQRHLLGAAVEVPEVCITLDSGATVRLPGLPELREATHAAEPLRIQVGNLTARDEAAAWTTDVATALVGFPQLEGTLGPAQSAGVLYWSLDVKAADGTVRTANGQVMPQRLAPSSAPQPFSFGLAPVAVHLQPGDQVVLAVRAHHPLYAAAGSPGGVVDLSELRVTLPTLCQECLG